MRNYINLIIYTGIILANFMDCSESEKAEVIFINGKIWTGNSTSEFAEAIAVKGEIILACGSESQVRQHAVSETKIVDLKGHFVTPGFIDCHVHFLTGGFNLNSVQLRNAKTPEEFIQRIADYAKTIPKGQWILGGDWDHENWGGQLPDREWIDIFTLEHPVFITRLDGHMSLANSLALNISGIDDEVKDVEGGSIIRRMDGTLTGIFKDNAASLIQSKIPLPSAQEIDHALKTAMDYVASHGVTSVHHMVGYMDALEKARKLGTLKTRIYAMMALHNWKDLKEKIDKEGAGDHWLKIGGLKGFVDGSLGSHTAAFQDPYQDAPLDSGFFVNTTEDLHDWIKDADQAELQIMIHAIGDKAIHFLLNTYEQVTIENGPRDRRFRIEHAQHISPKDIDRFNSLQVIPSMQPYHAIDDGRWAEKLIGSERIKTTYAFKSLLENEATLVFGSDWFVAPPTPLEGIYAAVTRRTLDGENPNGWVPEQKISVEEALIAYTRDAAFASFEEDIKGTLKVGKLADFVVLDKDLFTINPEELQHVKVLETFVGGKKVFDLEDDSF